jgi:hypothetical protein
MYPSKTKLDVDANAWFTGACLTMAKALKRELGSGSRLVDVVEPEARSTGKPLHVVVEKDGLYWDAAGPHTKQELLSFWQRLMRSQGVTRPLKLSPHDPARARAHDLTVKPNLQKRAAIAAERIRKRAIGH